MNIAISGATGCVGRALCSHLQQVGHNITPISRAMLTMQQLGNLQDVIDSSDVVINLAGTPISKRWNRVNLRKIFESRIGVTKLLVDMINRSSRPSLFISASAAGYHSSELLSKPDMESDEILPRLIDKWEEQARRVNTKTRLVIARLGIVFAPKSGALPKMIESRKWGFLSRIGGSDKELPWVALEDVTQAVEQIIEHKEVSGAVNFLSPKLSTQEEFLRAAKQALGVRFILQIPEIALKLIYGRAAQLILKNRYLPPLRLRQMGYKFNYPDIESYFCKVKM